MAGYNCPPSFMLDTLPDGKKWRRGWDSNPRYGFPYARFRGEYFQPLSHLSAVVAIPIVARVLSSGNLGLLTRDLAAGSEEGLKDGSALGGENTRNDFHLVIKCGVSENFEARTDGAALRIVRAVDKARDAGLDDGPRAHATRL